MLETRLDHLVVTASSRDVGVAWVSSLLGVPLEPGGEHPSMGTHNALLRLGDARYLEVLAPNPATTAPDRPRWFGLSALGADATPRLAGWVARTNDIERATASASLGLGSIESASRGAVRWRITIAADGWPPEGGAAPALIQWEGPPHPATALLDRGCSLAGLELFHPEPERLRELLSRLGLVEHFTVSGRRHPGLIGHIQTPSGVRSLGSSSSNP